MPKEREIQTPSGTSFTASDEDRKENSVINPETREEKKARLARITTNGYISSRLSRPTNIPPNLWFEWVPRDPVEIDQKKLVGFKVADEFFEKGRLTSNDNGVGGIGDVVPMVQSMEDHEVMVEIRQDRIKAMHEIKQRKEQREEKEYIAQMISAGLIEAGITPISEGSVQRKTISVD